MQINSVLWVSECFASDEKLAQQSKMSSQLVYISYLHWDAAVGPCQTQYPGARELNCQ